MTKTKVLLTFLLVVSLCGCGAAAKIVNPFYEEPTELALQGEANDNALSGSALKEDSARKALEQMATYQRTQYPSPDKPVMQPAVVRLMWVPDHLNRHGDLVPAHYYYLKVLNDRWAVTDAFELEGQLNRNTQQSVSSIPYVSESDSFK